MSDLKIIHLDLYWAADFFWEQDLIIIDDDTFGRDVFYWAPADYDWEIFPSFISLL